MLKSLGKGAAAVTKAALETEGGAAVYASFQDKKESLMSSVQEGKKAIKKRVLAASVATMNGAVYAALPEARKRINKTLTEAVEAGTPLVTMLPRPPKKAERQRLKQEGKELPPPLYQAHVRQLPAAPGSPESSASPQDPENPIQVLSFSIRKRRKKRKPKLGQTPNPAQPDQYAALPEEEEADDEEDDCAAEAASAESRADALEAWGEGEVPAAFADIAEQVVVRAKRQRQCKKQEAETEPHSRRLAALFSTLVLTPRRSS